MDTNKLCEDTVKLYDLDEKTFMFAIKTLSYIEKEIMLIYAYHYINAIKRTMKEYEP